VEINGSTHFYNFSDRLLPKYRLKDDILRGVIDYEGKSLRFININYQEWLNDNMEVKATELLVYLDRVLAEPNTKAADLDDWRMSLNRK
jgi:hypothetical protein